MQQRELKRGLKRELLTNTRIVMKYLYGSGNIIVGICFTICHYILAFLIFFTQLFIFGRWEYFSKNANTHVGVLKGNLVAERYAIEGKYDDANFHEEGQNWGRIRIRKCRIFLQQIYLIIEEMLHKKYTARHSINLLKKLFVTKQFKIYFQRYIKTASSRVMILFESVCAVNYAAIMQWHLFFGFTVSRCFESVYYHRWFRTANSIIYLHVPQSMLSLFTLPCVCSLSSSLIIVSWTDGRYDSYWLNVRKTSLALSFY